MYRVSSDRWRKLFFSFWVRDDKPATHLIDVNVEMSTGGDAHCTHLDATSGKYPIKENNLKHRLRVLYQQSKVPWVYVKFVHDLDNR